jgi:hypothetical protein
MWALTPGNLDALSSKLGARVVPTRKGRMLIFKTTRWSYDVAVPGDTIEPTADGYVRVVRRKV